jgi:hypothetical protein
VGYGGVQPDQDIVLWLGMVVALLAFLSWFCLLLGRLSDEGWPGFLDQPPEVVEGDRAQFDLVVQCGPCHGKESIADVEFDGWRMFLSIWALPGTAVLGSHQRADRVDFGLIHPEVAFDAGSGWRRFGVSIEAIYHLLRPRLDLGGSRIDTAIQIDAAEPHVATLAEEDADPAADAVEDCLGKFRCWVVLLPRAWGVRLGLSTWCAVWDLRDLGASPFVPPRAPQRKSDEVDELGHARSSMMDKGNWAPTKKRMARWVGERWRRPRAAPVREALRSSQHLPPLGHRRGHSERRIVLAD